MGSSDTESLEALKSEVLHKEGEEINKLGDDESGGRLEDAGEKKKEKKKKLAVMMRLTISELENALKESHELLSERDREIVKLKKDIDHYKQQAAKEVAMKTKLAQSVDESHQQAQELEETLKKWQLSLKEYQQRIQYLENALQQEHIRSVEQEKRYGEIYSKKSHEVEQLKSQLIEARQKLPKDAKRTAGTLPSIDESQLLFLKQAVYHMLTDSHAEEHLRAIVSILNFSVQERKAVYAKVQERKGKGSSGRPL